jgi:glycerate 2-kinase
MRIVIAPDSFKESLSAPAVAEAMAEGVMRAAPDADFDLVPMADGGEGTVDALVAATGGGKIEAMVTGPLGDPVVAEWGLLGDGKTAVVEMAAASGLVLVPEDLRDPRKTTTFGTGEVIAQVLEYGVERLIIGIGGSATNDGGAGMAQALGIALRDKDGKDLARGGAALANLAEIDASRKLKGLDQLSIEVACDVDNPLCGERGASMVYGPQKGADVKTAKELDKALRHFGEVVEKVFGIEVIDLPGAGAAGGLGAGLITFLGATLRPGASLIAEACGLAQKLDGADLILTGEGRLDGQSVFGKTPVGVAKLGQERGIPVIALAGNLGEGFERVYDHGISAAFSITHGPVSFEEAIQHTAANLANTAEAAVRLFLAGKVS